MNIEDRIEQIKCSKMRDTARLFVDGKWLRSYEVGFEVGIKTSQATIRIKQLINNHGFSFEFRTVMRELGGIAHEYRMVSATGGELTCVDEPLEREYTDGEFIIAMNSLTTKTTKKTLAILDNLTEYTSVQEIADANEMGYDSVRQRLQRLEHCLPNIFIHRYGGMNNMKLKLISFNRPDEHRRKKMPKQQPIVNKSANVSASLLNSVFS